jgi:hypothetical protein
MAIAKALPRRLFSAKKLSKAPCKTQKIAAFSKRPRAAIQQSLLYHDPFYLHLYSS